MSARLVVIAGPDQGKTFSLPAAGNLLIGRGRDATARLGDPHTSRSHCRVKVAGGQTIVEDLDSASGIFVNDARVRTQTLKPGDVLRLGSTLLRLEAEGVFDMDTVVPPPAPPRLPAGVKPARAAPAAPPAPALPPLYNLSGQPLSHFQVGPVIAPGKSGVVFRARDTRENKEAERGRLLDGRAERGDKEVALKVFLPAFSQDEEEVQRFLRAMKTMLPLRHPHLAAIRAAGRAGPHCWVAMDLVEGVGLNALVQQAAIGARDWRVAFRAMLHVARVLAYLHGQHIIHRNVTPSNVLLCTLDGTVKLGDLMTVKAQEGKLSRQVTQAGELLGDVRYLSPEQTTNASAGDGRADLYSLGATAYAVMAGRAPLEGRTAVETILQIRQLEPVPLRQLQPTIPPAVEAVVMKLLAKRPEDRFASPGELLSHLGSLSTVII